MTEPTGILTVVMLDSRDATSRMAFDPSWVHRVIARANEFSKELLPRNGNIVRPLGAESSLTALFTTASHALRFVCDLQRRLQDPHETGEPYYLRCAVYTAEVDENIDLLEGWIFSRCEHLKDACHDGQTLVSRSTHAVIGPSIYHDIRLKDLGPKHLNDLARAERIYQLGHHDLRDDYPSPTIYDPPANNLPQRLTGFVGRFEEIEEVKQRFYLSRFTTLTGPGGVGKTRLAIEVAKDLVQDHYHGAYFVDLAPVRDPELITQAVAKPLGIPTLFSNDIEESLIEYLRDKELLLVLDNCEHLLAEVANLVEKLTGACPNLQVLATSRQPIGVRGETVVRINPFSVPEPGNLKMPIEEYDAVKLFLDRAYLVEPNFSPTPEEMEVIGGICSDLDGIPLAIELAAAKVSEQKVKDLAKVLKKQLSGRGSRARRNRQSTMEAVTQWSYDLLTENEQKLFRRLSVFVGSFDRYSAEHVCSSQDLTSEQIDRCLDLLTHKSMVVRDTSANRFDRYRLLETMSEFGRGLLTRAGTLDYWKNRHCEHYAKHVEEAAANIHGEHQRIWMEQLELDHDNYRAALDWSLGSEEDIQTPFKVILSIHMFWFFRGYYNEAVSFAERLLKRLKVKDVAKKVTVLNLIGSFCGAAGDLNRALKCHQEALKHSRKTDNPALHASSLVNTGIIERQLGHMTKARKHMMDCLSFCEKEGIHDRVYWLSMMNAGGILGDLREDEESERLLTTCLAHFDSTGDLANAGTTNMNLGVIRRQQNRLDESEAFLAVALNCFIQLRDLRGLSMTLCEMAFVSTQRELYYKAAALLGIEEVLRCMIRGNLLAYEPHLYEEAVAACRKALGQSRFEEEWAKGTATRVEDLPTLLNLDLNR